jgi:hypothetical protein
MNRKDINYWMSHRFDPSPPTDEEMTRGHPITKPQLARLIADDIKTMVERGFTADRIALKVDQLAGMVKDDPEPQSEDDQTHE